MRTLVLPTSWGPLRLLGGSRAGEATVVVAPSVASAGDPASPPDPPLLPAGWPPGAGEAEGAGEGEGAEESLWEERRDSL